MSRSSRLLLLHEAGGQQKTPASKAEVISTSQDGIPIGWVFCFGGRNFLDPEDNVVQRHGTAAERDPFTTPLEVAEARLANVISVLEENPHLYAWYSALNILRQQLAAKDSKGTVLKLDAPWLKDKRSDAKGRMRTIAALGENYVHYSTPGRHGALATIGDDLEKECPFIPRCTPDDPKRFAKAPAMKNEKPAIKAAALLIGLPETRKERFAEAVNKYFAPELAKLDNLPEYPKAQALPKATKPETPAHPSKKQEPKAAPGKGKTPPVEKQPEPKAGLFGKIKALFGRG